MTPSAILISQSCALFVIYLRCSVEYDINNRCLSYLCKFGTASPQSVLHFALKQCRNLSKLLFHILSLISHNFDEFVLELVVCITLVG